ncbi:MAG: hypothetical protein R6U96_03345 [Promethearchaeia archaeon]
MKKFLNQLGLSDGAINLYLKSLINSPLTFYEIKSIMPDSLSQKELKETLAELEDHNLIIIVRPDSSETLSFYYSIPPISPILNYYSNINENLPNINEKIRELLSQSLENIFENENPVKLDSLLEDFNYVYKDLDEQYLIQKHDVDDLIKDIKEIKNLMETIPEISEIFRNVHERIRSISQIQFAKLIKILKNIRKKITKQVKELEMRKHEEEIIEIVENVFKENLQEMVDDFTNELFDLIDEEFDKVQGPIDEKVKGPLEGFLNKSFSQLDELKTLYYNTIDQFKEELEKIKEIIVTNKENLDENLDQLKQNISEGFNDVVLESLTNVSQLSKPIQTVLETYYESMLTPEAFSIENFWEVKSITRINEEIFQIVNNSKDQVMLILPKLEHHINLDMFEKVDTSINFKIAAANPHTNSKVKKYKEKSNITYRQLSNKRIIAVQGDDNHILIAVKKPDTEDILDNCLGFSTNYKPLIKVLTSSIKPIWKAAKSEKVSRTKVEAGSSSKFQRERPQLTPVGRETKTQNQTKQPVKQTSTAQGQTTQKTQTSSQPSEAPKNQKGEKSAFNHDPTATTSQKPETTSQQSTQKPAEEAQPTQNAQSTGQFKSQVHPDPSDPVAVAIDNAFNKLLQNLNSMNGIQFSQLLEQAADVILEQKGFSVTLHNIRKWINSYKNKKEPLSGDDKSQIFSAIETWKKRIFE